MFTTRVSHSDLSAGNARTCPHFTETICDLGVDKELDTLTQCHSVLQWKECSILIVSGMLLHRQWHMLYWLCNVHKIFSLPWWPTFVNNFVGSSSFACARGSFLATAQWSCSLVKRRVHRHFLSSLGTYIRELGAWHCEANFIFVHKLTLCSCTVASKGSV